MNKLQETQTALCNYASQHGWPSMSEWNKYAKTHGYLGTQGIYHHTRQKWEDYRKSLGFPPRNKSFTKEECIEAIKKAAIELGEFFTKKQYTKWQKAHPNFPSPGVITNRFESWNAAKIAAGLVPNASWGKEFSDEEILTALKDCAQALGTKLFSEEEYMKWRGKNTALPHIETIRKRFGGLAKAKEAVGLESYKQGGRELQYAEGRWKESFLLFLRQQLSCYTYEKWAKENNGPSMNVLREYAGGYEKALLECLNLYIQKIKEGRRKR